MNLWAACLKSRTEVSLLPKDETLPSFHNLLYCRDVLIYCLVLHSLGQDTHGVSSEPPRSPPVLPRNLGRCAIH